MTISFTNYPNLSVTPNTGTFISGTSITFNPTASTSYTVTGDDGTGPAGCSNSTDVNITVNPAPGAPGLTPSSSQQICVGGSVTVSAAVGVIPSNILTANFNSGDDGFTVASTGSPTTTGFQLKAAGYDLGADGLIFNSTDNSQSFISDVDVAGTGSSVNTTLTSPAFNTLGYASATLTFSHYYKHLTTDSEIVEINANGGAWTRLVKYITTQGTPTSGTGTVSPIGETLAIPASFIGASNVRVRFRYRGGWVWYWAIDNVAITGTPNPIVYSVSPTTGASVTGSTITLTPTTTTTYTVLAAYSGTLSCTGVGTPITINVSQPSFTVVKTNPTCNGGINGTITVTATGGYGTYQYALNGGAYQASNVFSGLAPGIYTLDVQDVNGALICQATQQSVAIGQPTTITFTTNTTATCTGGMSGTLTVTGVSGGNGIGYEYSIDNGMTFQAGNTFTGLAPATYQVVVQDSSSCPSAAQAVVLSITNTLVWVGSGAAGGDDWFTAANWSPACVPSATSDVILPNRPVDPIIAAGTALVHDLTLQVGGVLYLNGGTLSVAGNLTNSGSFLQNAASTVAFTGATMQTIGQAATTAFQNLTIGAAGATLSGPVQILQVLTLTGNLAPNGFLTLVSNATATGMIVNSGGAVTGPATVQRFIDGSVSLLKGYRHLSSPVAAAPFSDLATFRFSPYVNPAYNTNPNQPANFFPDIFGFDEARLPDSTFFDFGYYSPTAVSNTMTVGRGWSAYFPSNVTYDLTGVPTTGNVALTGLTHTGPSGPTLKSGWHLLGNPYPAPMDWDLVTPGSGPGQIPAGMDASIFVFQATGGLSGTYLSRTNGFGTLTNGWVAQGQGFFSHISGAGPVNFTFGDNLRLTTYANPSHYRTAAPASTSDTRPVVSLELHKVGAPVAERDQAYVYFQTGATVDLDAFYDGQAPSHNRGVVPTLASLTRNADELTINGLPPSSFQPGGVVELLLDLPAVARYTLSTVMFANLPATPNAVVLLDRLLNVRTPLADSVVYSFTATRPGVLTGRFALEFFPSLSPTGLAGAVATPVLLVYPNPTGAVGQVQVVGVGAGERVTLLDATGRTVRVSTASEHGALLDVANLAAGVYTVRAAGATRRLVVE